jgi:hypothetical protein
MMMYRYAKSRADAKIDSRLQMPTMVVPPEPGLIKAQDLFLKASQSPATRSDADRGIPA